MNRIEVLLTDSDSNTQIDSHVLDFSLRTGFDASDEGLLDTQDIPYPYIDPVSFTDDSTEFITNIVIPQAWLPSANGSFELEVRTYDIWGNATQFNVTSIPEPHLATLLMAFLLPGLAVSRRRAI